MLAIIFLVGGALTMLYNFYKAWLFFPAFRDWRFVFILAATAIVTYPIWPLWLIGWIIVWLVKKT